jgi:hypothetical protein
MSRWVTIVLAAQFKNQYKEKIEQSCWEIYKKELGMLRIATKTKLTPEEVTRKAIKFFGPEGYKLKLTNQMGTSATFEGGGGSIEVSACADSGKTMVDFLPREWDFQVKEFIKMIR